MAKLLFLYPGSYFDFKKTDEDYEYEVREAVRFPDVTVIHYNYDGFTAGEKLKLYPPVFEEGICIYRGWMLKPDRYRQLYEQLSERGLTLINTPEEYENCHEFPGSYPLLSDFTPPIRVFPPEGPFDWAGIRRDFGRFMMKDYVKSVKGTDFPVFFDAAYSDEALDQYVKMFIDMRGELFVNGIVIKKYLDLKRVNGVTNEYRVFYLDGKILTVSPNSNQRAGDPVPGELLLRIPRLHSHFYTIDFAQLENGEWTVIETGDGQVSGLSPNQFVFKFYESLTDACKWLELENGWS